MSRDETTSVAATAPRACVIGWPVAHSRSPLIHGYWLETYGIVGSYERAAIEPANLSAFLRDLGEQGFVGANVTLPHKTAAFALCDVVTDTARRLEAVNTLWIEQGKLLGDNTDVTGFLGNFDQECPGWDYGEKNAIVLGAGGAARAIVQALLQRRLATITLLNRTKTKAEALAALFGPRVRVAAWTEAPAVLAGAQILVNTTSLGMAGQPALDLDLRHLPGDAIVNDIVYVPLETPLLATACARGLRTVGGLGMLLHQAVPGFEHWFGRRPEVTPVLRARLIAAIESHA